MDKPQNSLDLWRIPILILWMAFFATGLYPEWVYDQTRELGRVAAQRALTNSAWLITFAWAGYMGWFTLARCREAGDSHASATAKGVQVLLLGLTAFMPLRLENIAEVQYIPVPEYRWIIYGTVGAKGVAWLYLALVILRYYLFSGYLTFINMPALFPSAHKPDAENLPPSQAHPPTSSPGVPESDATVESWDRSGTGPSRTAGVGNGTDNPAGTGAPQGAGTIDRKH